MTTPAPATATNPTYTVRASERAPGTWDVLTPDGAAIETRHDTAWKAQRAATIFTLQGVALAVAAEPHAVPVYVTGRRRGGAPLPPERVYVETRDDYAPVSPTGFVHVQDWGTDWTARTQPHARGYVVGLPVQGYAPDGRVVFEQLLGTLGYDDEAPNAGGGRGAVVHQPPATDALAVAIRDARTAVLTATEAAR